MACPAGIGGIHSCFIYAPWQMRLQGLYLLPQDYEISRIDANDTCCARFADSYKQRWTVGGHHF
jgi:hypothetical protein